MTNRVYSDHDTAAVSIDDVLGTGADPATREIMTHAARPDKDGISAIHTHMTNTMNTPVEAMEFAFPLRLKRYAVRRGSGGDGKFKGGDGVIREVEFLGPARVTLMSERRKLPPPGYHGGHHGATGENVLLKGGYEEIKLAGKELVDVEAGDVISMRTPGAGGWGAPEGDQPSQ